MNDKKRYIMLLVIGILMVICVLLGSTYAFMGKNIESESVTDITLNNCAKLTLLEKSSSINLQNASPMSDNAGMQTTPYSFTIKSSCSVSVEYKIYLGVLSTSSLGADKVKYAIKETDSDNIISIGNLSLEASDDFNESEMGEIAMSVGDVSEIYAIMDSVLVSKTSTDYELYLWIDSNASNEIAGQFFSAGVLAKSFNDVIPVIKEVTYEATYNSIALNVVSDSSSGEIVRYYYSIDDGATFKESEESTYLFEGLEDDTEYKIKVQVEDSKGDMSTAYSDTVETYFLGKYNFSNDVQTKKIRKSGYYKLEVWGAQGGYRNSSDYGGKGGYSSGIVYLNNDDEIYVYVGGAGGNGANGCGTDICLGGFNGGGARYKYYGGGGATDIRINSDSLYSRVIVAGGGGSDGATSKYGMYGGGLNGGSSTESYSYVGDYGGKGGTQNYSGYSAEYTISTPVSTGLTSFTLENYAGGFGFGGGGVALSSGYGGAGGGGWYGGSGNVPDGSGDDDRGGGGGSGYVYTEESAANYPDGCLLNSAYYLTEASTVAGNTTFLNPDGVSETGHSGDGYAKVTYIGTTLE